jgi:hypothetical protein
VDRESTIDTAADIIVTVTVIDTTTTTMEVEGNTDVIEKAGTAVMAAEIVIVIEEIITGAVDEGLEAVVVVVVVEGVDVEIRVHVDYTMKTKSF